MDTSVSYSKMTGVSDYIKNNLQNIWTKDGGNVYVNMDSFWDAIVMNDPTMKGTDLHVALVSFVEHCHKNGQRAGIYYTPFACWHNTEEDMKRSKIYDTGYTYYDAALQMCIRDRYSVRQGSSSVCLCRAFFHSPRS